MSPTWPRLARGDWHGTHRLVPATYVDRTEPYLAELVDPASTDPDEDIAALTTLTAATSTRLQTQAGQPGLALGGHELVYDLDWSQVVNGAFAYPGQGGRFHDMTRGAWYAALEVETSLAEVIHHRAVALAEIDVWDDEGEWQDFVSDLGGEHFADLRDSGRRTRACLDPDSWLAGQDLAGCAARPRCGRRRLAVRTTPCGHLRRGLPPGARAAGEPGAALPPAVARQPGARGATCWVPGNGHGRCLSGERQRPRRRTGCGLAVDDDDRRLAGDPHLAAVGGGRGGQQADRGEGEYEGGGGALEHEGPLDGWCVRDESDNARNLAGGDRSRTHPERRVCRTRLSYGRIPAWTGRPRAC